MSNIKKVGPPVPPRPTATQVASALSKSRSCSPTVSQSPIKSGRTVIYKSPSFDEKHNSTDSLKNQVSEVSRAPIPKPRLISPVHTIKNNGSIDLPSHQTTVAEINSELSRISLKSAGIEVKSNLKSIDLIKVDSSHEKSQLINNGNAMNDKSETASVNLCVSKMDSQTIEFTNRFMDEMVASMSLKEKLPLRPEPEGKEEHSNREGSDSSTSDSYISASSTQNSIKSSSLIEKSFEEKLSEKKSMFSEMLISEIIASHPPMSPPQKIISTVLGSSKSQRASISELASNETPPKSHSTPKSTENQSISSSSSNRERVPSTSSNDTSPQGTQRSPRIRTSDWIELGDNGKEIVMTSCHISLEDSGMEDEERLDDASSGVGDSWDSVKDSEERMKMTLPGLPPLPKSLSGFQEAPVSPSEDSQRSAQTPQQTTTLDTQLATLRREMYGLRQLDLSLLSQLWTLNESIQEFRTIVQEQEALSPPSPSPSNSGSELPSSDDESPIKSPSIQQQSQSQLQLQSHRKKIPNRVRAAPPPPPPRDCRKSQLSLR